MLNNSLIAPGICKRRALMFNNHFWNLLSKPMGARLFLAFLSSIRFLSHPSTISTPAQKACLPSFYRWVLLYLMNHPQILTLYLASLWFDISTWGLSLEFDPSTSFLQTRQGNTVLHMDSIYPHNPWWPSNCIAFSSNHGGRAVWVEEVWWGECQPTMQQRINAAYTYFRSSLWLPG